MSIGTQILTALGVLIIGVAAGIPLGQTFWKKKLHKLDSQTPIVEKDIIKLKAEEIKAETIQNDRATRDKTRTDKIANEDKLQRLAAESADPPKGSNNSGNKGKPAKQVRVPIQPTTGAGQSESPTQLHEPAAI